METTFVQDWNNFGTLRQDGGDPSGAGHVKASLGKIKTRRSANTTKSSEMNAAPLFNRCPLIPNHHGENFWTTLEQVGDNFGTTL